MKDIAIWGTGGVCNKVLPFILLSNEYRVVCFYDNNSLKWGQKIMNIPIKKYSRTDKIFIVICSESWQEIITQINGSYRKDWMTYRDVLNNNTLEYSVYSFLRKLPNGKTGLNQYLKSRKLAVIYGNCQTNIYNKIFMLSDDFKKKYVVIEIPNVFDLKNNYRDLMKNDDSFWKSIDLFIYQEVKETFGIEFSTRKILNKLKPGCTKVKIVNVFFTGYFPGYRSRKFDVLKGYLDVGEIAFPYEDKIFIDLAANFSFDQTLEKLIDPFLLSENEILKNANDSLEELKRREKGADVKIVDYIENNWKSYRLFYAVNHPVNQLLLEYTNRILKYLKIDVVKFAVCDIERLCGDLSYCAMPIYPCVLNAMNWQGTYFDKGKLLDEWVGFNEYYAYYYNGIHNFLSKRKR